MKAVDVLRGFALAVALLMLAGCVLQASPPLFAEKQGEMVFKGQGTQFVSYSLNRDTKAWEKDDEPMVFNAVGKHYESPTKSGVTSLSFIALQKGWWVVQGAEDGGPSGYMLAQRQGKAMLLYPLMCTNLKKVQAIAPKVRFEGDDCFAGKDFGLATFRAMIKSLPPAALKIEPAA
ncbi:MAG: hypothetical protein LCH46_12430 [Proteobacteria bacterium]|nr:hypothetical protein [Pseudomonadota bacterium]